MQIQDVNTLIFACEAPPCIRAITSLATGARQSIVEPRRVQGPRTPESTGERCLADAYRRTKGGKLAVHVQLARLPASLPTAIGAPPGHLRRPHAPLLPTMFILPSNKPWRHRFTAPVYCRRRCHESCRHPEREPALSLRHRRSQPHVSRTGGQRTFRLPTVNGDRPGQAKTRTLDASQRGDRCIKPTGARVLCPYPRSTR